MHIAGNNIQHHQIVLKLKAERRILPFAVYNLRHIFLRRHLVGHRRVASDATACQQPLQSTLPDLLFAGLIEQRSYAQVTRNWIHAEIGAIERHALCIVRSERSVPGDQRPIG